MLNSLSLNIFVKVKFYLVPASRALDVLFKPSPKTVQVEDVSTFEFLGLLDFLQTNDASVIHTDYLFSRHIRKFIEFIDKLSRLDKELDTLAKSHDCINDFT